MVILEISLKSMREPVISSETRSTNSQLTPGSIPHPDSLTWLYDQKTHIKSRVVPGLITVFHHFAMVFPQGGAP